MPEPVTMALVGGGALLLLLRGKKEETPSPPPGAPPPPPDPCATAATQAAVAGAVQGAASGAPAGPYGAGAGAGLALMPYGFQCGPQKFSEAFRQLCGKADKAAAELKRKGFELPKQYNTWSCEQRMAFIAGLASGVGLPVLLALTAGNLAINSAEAYKRGLKSAERSVETISKRLKLPVPKFADDLLRGGGSVVETVSSGAKKITSAFHGAPRSVGNLNGLGEAKYMRRSMDVDFGYLGNFGEVASGTGTQARGSFGATAAAPNAWAAYGASYTANSARTGVSQETQTGLINAGAGLIGNVLAMFGPKKTTIAPAAGAPATVVVQGGGSSLPSWALPVGGALLIGGLVLAFSKRR